MEQVKLSSIPEGEFFKRKPEAKMVLVRGEYDRSSKTYCAHDFDDVGNCFNFKGDKLVWVGFEF